MPQLNFNKEKIAKSWVESANRKSQTMTNLLKSNDNNWALFIGHLVIEKLLKGLYVSKFETIAPHTHDLLRLSRSIKLDINGEFEEWLDTITTFNINARYENYKQDFYKLCTNEFTDIWVQRIRKIEKWLTSQF